MEIFQIEEIEKKNNVVVRNQSDKYESFLCLRTANYNVWSINGEALVDGFLNYVQTKLIGTLSIFALCVKMTSQQLPFIDLAPINLCLKLIEDFILEYIMQCAIQPKS